MSRTYKDSLSTQIERDDETLSVEVTLQVTPGRNGPSGFYWDAGLGNFCNDDPGEVEILAVTDEQNRPITLTDAEEERILEDYHSKA